MIRLIHGNWVASSGSTTAPPAAVSVDFSPIIPDPTTPRNTVNNSPMLDDSK